MGQPPVAVALGRAVAAAERWLVPAREVLQHQNVHPHRRVQHQLDEQDDPNEQDNRPTQGVVAGAARLATLPRARHRVSFVVGHPATKPGRVMSNITQGGDKLASQKERNRCGGAVCTGRGFLLTPRPR